MDLEPKRTPAGWRAAAWSRAVRPGRFTRALLDGRPLLLGRSKAGAAYALSDLCPHRGAALSTGRARVEPDGRESVECPYHLWRFTHDGACVAIPGREAAPGVRAPSWPLTERDGRVWIWTRAGPPRGEPPQGKPAPWLAQLLGRPPSS
ncbi:MAG: Rieske 2Fe-2S domain-containing protein [Caulobacter sp.]|nr:Rieske 2Fe-2S domain-containing protein [Caulobacter sp.]